MGLKGGDEADGIIKVCEQAKVNEDRLRAKLVFRKYQQPLE
jgi:hypothetical protein